MKKLLIFIMLLSILPFQAGCRDKEQNTKTYVQKEEEYVQIIAPNDGIWEKCAQYISAILSEKGYSSKISKEPSTGGCMGVICMGDLDYTGELPCVRCTFSPAENDGEYTVSPFLTSKSLARAAVLLLPDAKRFSVISEAEGAADVQDACDFLDMSAVDYTVETLDGRPYGEAVLAAAKKGCDAVILSSKSTGGISIDLSEYETAVIAVGEGEPVRGALGTFCINTEAVSEAAADAIIAVIEGREPEESFESFYSFCISEGLSREFGADISAVCEDFSVVVTQ